jgi:hypothetical protein
MYKLVFSESEEANKARLHGVSGRLSANTLLTCVGIFLVSLFGVCL